jgi:protein-S-isoprenylcysteine O-methyltransferase Ste14
MPILRAITGLLVLLAVLGGVLFAAAGTTDYRQAWTFLIVFGCCTLAITLYLMVKDRALLERRTRAGPGAETTSLQRLISALASLAFIAIFIVSAFAHRFAWAATPRFVEILGAGLVGLGLFFVFLVFRENTYTSGAIEVAEGQKVISTGPYGLVRHPMYAGAFVMLVGVPLSLGSYWGLIPVALLMLIIAARAVDEERFLDANLPGYSAYRAKVRARVVPLVW